MSFFKRRSIGKILAVTMLFSTLMPAIAYGEEGQFKDIADSYASQEINQLAKSGVISGYEDNLFQPKKAMTRAELAKMIALLLGLKESPDRAASYLDVRADSWYRGYVGALAEAGIVQGHSNTTFSPDSLVTREELVVFFIRGLGLEAMAKQLPAESSLTDLAGVSEWARPHVAIAHRIGFIDGIDNGDGTVAFNPKENAERQALARLAYEFQLHKEYYVNAAKALITGAIPVKPEAAEKLAENVDIRDIKAVGLNTIEVTFGSAVKTVRKSDYSFDNGLTVTDAALKSGSSSIVVLTIAGHLSGTTYKLAYKGKATGKSVLIEGKFSVGGYSGAIEETDSNENDSGSGIDTIETVKRQLASGVAQETVTITESGTYGSENGPDTPVQRLIIDPGPTGEVSLQHIVPEVLEVLSGDVNTIKLMNTVIKQLRVNAINNGGRDVRIESRDGTSVENTTVESQAVLESSSATGKLGKITLASSASGRTLTLKGNIDGEVTVDAPGAQVSIQPPSNGNPLPTVINKLSLAKNAKVNTDGGTKLSSVNVTGQNTVVDLSGQGSVSSVNVDPSASGTKLNLGEDTNVSAINANSDVTLSGSPDAIAKVKTEGSSSIQVDPDIQSEVKNKALANADKAIEAVGTPVAFSADLEAKLALADTAIAMAKSYGAADSEIVNLSKLTAAKETVKGWKEKVALERLSLTIGYQSGDDAASVTKSLTLRTKSGLVDSIAWTSDKPAVVDPLTGDVLRPAAGQPDAVVTLTAQVSLNGYSEVRTFAVSVKAQEPVNNEKAEAIEAAIKAVEAVGTPIAYSADLEAKLAQADTAIAMAKSHGATDSEIVNLSKLTAAKETVNGWKEKVALERLSLAIGYQSGDDAASVTKSLTLRTKSGLVDSIAWTSDKPAFVDPSTGDVLRPAAGQPDAVVTLTAQISLNGYSDTRSFVLTVKAQNSANSRPIASIIPQIDLTVGGAVYEIPYSALATDPDGDELTVTGITSTPALQVVKQANSLTIQAVSTGLPFLLVTVSDGRGGSVRVSIIVRISAAPAGAVLSFHDSGVLNS